MYIYIFSFTHLSHVYIEKMDLHLEKMHHILKSYILLTSNALKLPKILLKNYNHSMKGNIRICKKYWDKRGM